MKNLLMTSFVALSVSMGTAMANPSPNSADLNQIFSSQGNVAALSSHEMQTTEGRYSALSALIDLADNHDGIDSDGDGRDADRTALPFGTINNTTIHAVGIDANHNGIDDGFEPLAQFVSPTAWASIVAAINNGTFLKNPVGFLQSIGVNPNLSVSTPTTSVVRYDDQGRFENHAENHSEVGEIERDGE